MATSRRQRIAKCYTQMDELSRLTIAYVKDEFPPGTTVRWSHGHQQRFGEVLEVLGFDIRHLDFWVRSLVSNKEFRVSVWSVLREEGVLNG